MKLFFHGVRGSLPVASPGVTRYGGNTSCLELRPAGGSRLIIDAGTGIRTLGKSLGKEGMCSLILTHEHWDHILGLPFFAPLYQPGWTIIIYVPEGGGGVLQRLMDGIAFPVRADDLAADIHVCEFHPGEVFHIGEMSVTTFPMPHPGCSTGLRVSVDGCTMALSGDCEISPAGNVPEVVRELLQDAEIAVVDGQYTIRQYEMFRGWGHSPRDVWIDPAVNAGVRRLVFTHHDVDSTDDMLDAERDLLRARHAPLPLRLELAYEGLALSGGTSHD